MFIAKWAAFSNLAPERILVSYLVKDAIGVSGPDRGLRTCLWACSLGPWLHSHSSGRVPPRLQSQGGSLQRRESTDPGTPTSSPQQGEGPGPGGPAGGVGQAGIYGPLLDTLKITLSAINVDHASK